MIIIPIILFLLVLAWDVITDYKKWKREDYNLDHKKEWWQRVALLVPCIIELTRQTHPPSVGTIIFALAISSLMVAFYWWFLFDGIYNLLRKKSWLYNGSDDAGELDADTDNFLMYLPDWAEVVIKLSLIAIFTTIYILMYGK